MICTKEDVFVLLYVHFYKEIVVFHVVTLIFGIRHQDYVQNVQILTYMMHKVKNVFALKIYHINQVVDVLYVIYRIIGIKLLKCVSHVLEHINTVKN